MSENWGSYGSWKDCPPHEYVTGFTIKMHSKQSGYFADDLAMTGMKIRCELGRILTSKSAPAGGFKTFADGCTSGFTAARVRIQGHQVRRYHFRIPTVKRLEAYMTTFTRNISKYHAKTVRVYDVKGKQIHRSP